MRIALFSPLPPSPTGIADYSLSLLRAIRPHHQVDAFVEQPAEPQAYHWREFTGKNLHEPYDLSVYQIGNSLHHAYQYPFVFHKPGLLVLHDLVLHHSRLAMYMNMHEILEYKDALHDVEKKTKAEARFAEYVDEVKAAYGDKGEAVAEVALQVGGGRLFYDHPLFELLARASRMTLVHSESARHQVLERVPQASVRIARMGMELPVIAEREQARKALGLESRFILASFGLVTPEKRIPAILRVFRRLVENGIDMQYVLVGRNTPYYQPSEDVRSLGLDERVLITGEVGEERFWQYVFAADLCLNLRYPTAAETSAALLRLLAAGRATIVTDQIHLLELPLNVVARVSLQDEDDGLYWLIQDLLSRTDKRKELEKNARSYVASRHQISHMAEDYLKHMEEARLAPRPGDTSLPAHLAGLGSARDRRLVRLAHQLGLGK